MNKFSSEEITAGLAALGRTREAMFLRERLLGEVMAVCGAGVEPCALSFREGRRSLASDLLRALALDLDNDGTNQPVSGRTSGGGDAGRGLERRVPVEPPLGYGSVPRPTGYGPRRRKRANAP